MIFYLFSTVYEKIIPIYWTQLEHGWLHGNSFFFEKYIFLPDYATPSGLQKANEY